VLLLLLLLGLGAGVAAESSGSPSGSMVHLKQIASGLVDPVEIANADDGSDRLFVVERVGRIRVIDAEGVLVPEPFLDISPRVQSGYIEQGLLGLAFHPAYRDNGRFFVAYTDFFWNGRFFITEFHVSASDPNRADPASARNLLDIQRDFVYHNGGTIAFGPDHRLYAGIGDGGPSEGDPRGNGQSTATLLGKLLRIDVDVLAGGAPYAIPPDNPFVGATPARPEIWAYGLRNPWQLSFDPVTGDLYLPDVGQTAWEEVNVLAAGGHGGQNFGWNRREGSHCFPGGGTTCPVAGTLPVVEYAHGDAGCAVSGIGVVRGALPTPVDGAFVYGDFCSGQLYVTACRCISDRRQDPWLDPKGTVWEIVIG